jgi:hypothetical protein
MTAVFLPLLSDVERFHAELGVEYAAIISANKGCRLYGIDFACAENRSILFGHLSLVTFKMIGGNNSALI